MCCKIISPSCCTAPFILHVFWLCGFCFVFWRPIIDPQALLALVLANHNTNYMIKFFRTSFCVIWESLYLSTITMKRNASSLFMLSFIFQHTSRTDAQVCVKNYNTDANNKDVITVDYMITGGRQLITLHPVYN